MVSVPVRCRIPFILKKTGRTQQWIADQCNLSKQQMSDYVHLRNLPGLVIAKRLAEELHCSMEDLYEWERREE